jgi:tRNA(Ile2) C34 agmatinyltransferase TiaS
MCSSAPTTSYGYELSIADEVDLNDGPCCCGDDMTSKDAGDGYRDWTCGDCGTVVTIDTEAEMVSDIREKQAA